MFKYFSKFILASFVICYGFLSLTNAQTVYYHFNNAGIYEFLDEMANEKHIQLNSAVKPYTRKMILHKLNRLKENAKGLNKRQMNELDFYLKKFLVDSVMKKNPYTSDLLNFLPENSFSALSLQQMGYYYKDQQMAFAVKPIWGIRYRTNEKGFVRHYRGGAKGFATIGSHFGAYASLRDNNMTKILAQPSHLTRQEGGNYKGNQYGGGDYSEMRGGINFSWNWGSVGLIKDHIQWGNNYHGSNIYSGRTPSFAMLKLEIQPVDWLDFSYFHGWLISEVVDSNRSYINKNGRLRTVFRQKNIAANMFTLRPWKGIHLSFGNSIIYSDLGGVHPAYLIPVMFYKSIDHTLNHAIDNQNSQLYLDLSIRKLKHVHVYASFFVDEFSVKRVGDPDRHNFTSFKTGARVSNFPVKNLSLTGEYTQTNPITFTHRLPVITFASNQYNLGHYLRNNAREFYSALEFRPFAKLRIQAAYTYAEKGKDNPYKFGPGLPPVDSYPLVRNKTWSSQAVSFSARYEWFSGLYFFAEYLYRDDRGYDVDNRSPGEYLDRYTPEFYQGLTHTVNLGLNIGF